LIAQTSLYLGAIYYQDEFDGENTTTIAPIALLFFFFALTTFELMHLSFLSQVYEINLDNRDRNYISN